MYFAPWSHREIFLYRPPTEHCYDKPIKVTARRVYKFSESEFVRRGNLDLIIVLSVKVETVVRRASKDVIEF